MLQTFPCPSYLTIFINSNISRASKFVALLAIRISVSRDYSTSPQKLFPKALLSLIEGGTQQPPSLQRHTRRSENCNDYEGWFIVGKRMDRVLSLVLMRAGARILLVNVDPRQGWRRTLYADREGLIRRGRNHA